MKRILITTMALVLPMVLMSCTEETLTTGLVEEPSIERPSEMVVRLERPLLHPSTVGRAALCKAAGRTTDCDAGSSKIADQGEFASPLFGLATAPNSDILVADAGAGVALREGALDILLPGITDIGPIGRSSMWATTGARADPTADTGQALYRISQGNTNLIVNLFEFEEAQNPDGNEVPDSNPFDVESLGGGAAVLVDAGGNDLLRVNKKGDVDVLAVFPDEVVSTANLQNLIGCPNAVVPGLAFICGIPMMPAQAVPTSVAIGPDGYYYVGELKGFPAPVGESNIWRVAPDASWAMCGSSAKCEKVFDGGFTSIIDLTFGPDGDLFVAELDEQSWFAVEFLGGGAGGSISSCDLGTTSCADVATGIPILTALTFGDDGTLWATKNALIPGLAEVIEVP